MAPALITAKAIFFVKVTRNTVERDGRKSSMEFLFVLSLSVSYQAASLKIKQARKRDGRYELYRRFAPSHSNVGEMEELKMH